MTESIRIPLSSHQIGRLNAFDAQIKTATDAKNEIIAIIVSGVVEPDKVGDWGLSFEPQAIVLTSPSKPALVGDIGPSGVSESAATG